MADMTDRELLIKLSTQLDNLVDDVKELKRGMGDMESKFVTKAEFEPYRRGMNIVAGLLLTAVIGAILALVISNGGTIIP